MRTLLTSSIFLLFTGSAFSQAAAVDTVATTSGNIGSGNTYLDILVIALALVIFALLLVAVTLLKTFNKLSAELINPTPIVKREEKALDYIEWKAQQKAKSSVWNKLLGLRPMSEEKDLMLEHEFDGISELDNPTPAWFMWLFYSTIVIAIGYMLTYHVFKWAPLQDEEYAIEMKDAEAAKKEYLSKSANLIDENSVTESNDAAILSAGQALYATNCVACHGDKGQGVVGPNLTDDYWLHGGTVNAIFKTIKYGVPEKGMISWEKVLTPKQISDITNYLHSLKGSNPPNPKAAQGAKEG